MQAVGGGAKFSVRRNFVIPSTPPPPVPINNDRSLSGGGSEDADMKRQSHKQLAEKGQNSGTYTALNFSCQ